MAEVVVPSELVALDEPSDCVGTLDVAASGVTGGVAPGEVDRILDAELFNDSGAVVVDVSICSGVEVEEINGGAFVMYEPDGCTA